MQHKQQRVIGQQPKFLSWRMVHWKHLDATMTIQPKLELSWCRHSIVGLYGKQRNFLHPKYEWCKHLDVPFWALQSSSPIKCTQQIVSLQICFDYIDFKLANGAHLLGIDWCRCEQLVLLCHHIQQTIVMLVLCHRNLSRMIWWRRFG